MKTNLDLLFVSSVFFFHLHLSLSQCPVRNFTITADDSMELYIDGERVNLTNAGNWRLADYVPLSCSAQVIAVKGIDIGGEAGIIGSTGDGYVLTNSSWRCTNVSSPGWERMEFNDSSWPAAYEIGPQGSRAWKSVDGISGNALWIWTSRFTGGDRSVCCRKRLLPGLLSPLPQTTTPRPQCPVRNFTITADDSMELYIDGERMNLTNAGNWRLADSVPLPCTAQVIAIKGIDIGGEAGIIGSTGDGYVLTNSSWRCTNVSSPGWEQEEFNDSSWPAAYEIGHQGSRTWKWVDGISGYALWIWTQGFTGVHRVVYCRKQLRTAPCPDRNLTITADDSMELYIDGERENLTNANNWRLADSVPLPCTAQVIAIKGIDIGGEAGIIASTGDGYVLTNSSWKCTNVLYSGWERMGFNDSSWSAAYEIGPQGSRTWKWVDGISRYAIWIWTRFFTGGDRVVYCRKQLRTN